MCSHEGAFRPSDGAALKARRKVQPDTRNFRSSHETWLFLAVVLSFVPGLGLRFGNFGTYIGFRGFLITFWVLVSDSLSRMKIYIYVLCNQEAFHFSYSR